MSTLKAAFQAITADIEARLIQAKPVAVASWQSVKAPQAMPEILNYSFTLDLTTVDQNPQSFAKAFKPNLPWADEHFITERVSGHPVNPGKTWRKWPYAQAANHHRREGEEDPQFDHSYAERYWPKHAGMTPDGRIPQGERLPGMAGYRFRYGDLYDLIKVLAEDPLTRQAYLPVWFPEDLGAIVDKKARVPCTLGYHFIRRDDLLHCIYPMRSCDYIRHFRDDVYLTVRLQLWILQCLRLQRFNENAGDWANVRLGTFTMHITSLHCFEIDQKNLRAKWKSQ